MNNYKDRLKEVQDRLNGIPGILENEFNSYGIARAKSRNKYSCMCCGSKDNLHLYSNTNTFHCFGCKVTGDVVSLVMNMEKVKYSEAVKILANKYGIEIPSMKYTEEDKKKFKEQKKQEAVYKKNKFKIDKAAAAASTIERKLLLSGLDEKSNAEVEYINYADYKPNEKYYIDKFISEENMSIVNLLLSNMNSLLIAPPGSGKTFSLIENCKRFNLKTIFVLPLASNVEQTANTYDIYAAYDKLDLKEALDKSDNIVVCTWDKLQQLEKYDISEYTVILDEVHQIYTDLYREKAIDNMLRIVKNAKSKIEVTATPTMLDFSEYEYIIEFVPNDKTRKDIKYYDNVDTKRILDIVNNPSNKSMVLINDKTILNMLSTQTLQKHDIISADTKNRSKLYKLLMENSTMGDYKALYHTTTLLASYNINDTDITDVIVVANKELKNISNIIQDIARPRKVEDIRVHIFGNFKEECAAVNVDWLIKKDILAWQKRADIYNETMIDNEFTTTKINASAAAAATSYIYFDKDLNKYMVDKVKIRADIYNNYYASRTMENHAALLAEYLEPGSDTIEFIKDVQEQQVELIKESKKAAKEAKKAIVEELEQHKDILVGYNDLVKGNVNYKLYNYMSANNINEDIVLKKYEDISLNINVVSDVIDLYSEYVLDYNYSYDLSWKLANMNHNTRKHKFVNPMKNIIYRNLREVYPNEVIDNIDNRVYDYLVKNIKPGMRYTTEHIELLSKDLINRYLDDKKYKLDSTRKLLSEIFAISSKQYRKGTFVSGVNFNFYINNNFTGDTFNKLTRVYTIENIKSIDDIKKELQLSSSDKSIEFAIDKKINNLVTEYEANKQIEVNIIKDIFNVC